LKIRINEVKTTVTSPKPFDIPMPILHMNQITEFVTTEEEVEVMRDKRMPVLQPGPLPKCC
jgi:hypothetical protein